MNGHGKSRRGFTLVEILLVLAIIAGVAAMLIPRLLESRNEANIKETEIVISKVMVQLEHYATNIGDYPTSEQGLKALIEKPTFDDQSMDKQWRGPYLNPSDINDAWNTPLSYKLDDVADSSGNTRKVPHVYSWGPNKKDDNGDGDNIKNKAWADETASAGK